MYPHSPACPHASASPQQLPHPFWPSLGRWNTGVGGITPPPKCSQASLAYSSDLDLGLSPSTGKNYHAWDPTSSLQHHAQHSSWAGRASDANLDTCKPCVESWGGRARECTLEQQDGACGLRIEPWLFIECDPHTRAASMSAHAPGSSPRIPRTPRARVPALAPRLSPFSDSFPTPPRYRTCRSHQLRFPPFLLYLATVRYKRASGGDR